MNHTIKIFILFFLLLTTLTYTHSLNAHNSFTQDHVRLAWKSFDQSNNDTALQLIQKALSMSRHNYKAHELAVRLYEIKGHDKKVIVQLLDMLKMDHPLNFFYIEKIYRSIHEKKYRNMVINSFLNLYKITKYHDIKNLLLYYLGHLYRDNGQFSLSSTMFNKLNWLTKWRFIGPFQNDNHSGFNKPYIPETTINYSLKYKVKRGLIQFKKPIVKATDGSINLKNLFYPNKGVIAYGVTYIHSNKHQKLILHIGASDGIKIWINDKLLLSHRDKKVFYIDQYRVKISLNQGWNKILLKSARGNRHRSVANEWKVSLRLTNLDSSLCSGLFQSDKIHLFRQDSNPINLLFTKHEIYLNPPKQILNYLNTLKLKDKYFYLSYYYYNKNLLNQAIKYFENTYNLKNKNTYYYNFIGRIYISNQNWGKGLSSFKQALQLHKNNFQSQVEIMKYYFHHSMYDRCFEILNRLIIVNNKNYTLLKYLILYYNYKKWNIEAYNTALKMVTSFPHSSEAYFLLANQYLKLSQIQSAMVNYYKSIKYNHNNVKSREKLFEIYLNKSIYNRAYQQLKSLIFLNPTSIRYRLMLAEYYLQRKLYKKTIETLFHLHKINQQNPQIYRQLGKTYALIGNKHLSIYYYNKALFYQPENSKLREYIQYLNPKKNLFFQQNILPESDIKKIIQSAPKIGTYPDARGVILLKRKLIQIFNNGSYNYLYHIIIQISNKEGIRYYKQINIPKKIDKLLKAVTIQTNGEEQDVTVFRRGKISFPSLQVGSIIEYKFIIEKRSGEWIDDHFYTKYYFQSTDPVLRSDLVFSIPKNKYHKIFLSDQSIHQTRSLINGNYHYHLSSQNNDQIQREPYRPPFEEISKFVMVTTIPSWGVLIKWHQSLITDQFEVDQPIKNKVKQLVKNLTNPIDKIKAIYYYVSNKIYYLENDVGIFGKLPNRCPEIFSNKFGDCKDKGTLFIAMLKEIGITAYYAAIRTNDSGQLIKDIPASQTNHIITYIPKQKDIPKGFFTDSTSEFYPFQYLRPDSQGVWAIILMGNNFKLVRTPVYPASKTISIDNYFIEFQNNKDLSVKALHKAQGLYAQRIRKNYKLRYKRNEFLEKKYNKFFGGISNLKSYFTPLYNMNIPVKIRSRFIVKDYIKVLQSKIYLQMFHSFDLSSILTSKENRKYDILFQYGIKKRINQKIKFPKGYIIDTLPKPFSFHINKIFSMKIDYQIINGYILVLKELTIERGHIKKSDYHKLKNYCRLADRSEKTTIIFKPIN